MERRLWLPEEDSALTRLVRQIGTSNWTLVSVRLAQKIQGCERSGKQCRQRWSNYLKNGRGKKPWTKAEERNLFDLNRVMGNKWKEIAKQMKTRTENQIKNHYYAALRKGMRRINKVMGYPHDATTIRGIKPAVLAAACNEERSKSESKHRECEEDVFSLILKFSFTEPSEEEANSLLSDAPVLQAIERWLKSTLVSNQEYLDQKKAKQAKKGSSMANHVASMAAEDLVEHTIVDISQYLSLESEEVRDMANGSSGSVKRESSDRSGRSSDSSSVSSLSDEEKQEL